jgi:Tfp pilus assembly protein PilV
MGLLRQGPCFFPGVTSPRGFALLDALLASTLLVVGVLSLTQIFALAARANLTARQLTRGSVLAGQKLEELRSSSPRVPSDGVDRIEEFTRRWSVVPLAADPSRTAVIQVSVTPGAVRFVTLHARGP